MTPETTSLASANSARGEWHRFAAFLKHTQLPVRAAGIGPSALVGMLRMLGLDLLLMGMLIGLAGAVTLAGFEPPDHLLNDFTLTGELILLIVVVGPVLEELAFRSWLSGRPGHLAAVALLGLGGLALLGTPRSGAGSGPAVASLGLALALLASAIAAIWLLRQRGALGWFRRAFLPLFALSTLAFALLHLLNYEEGSLVGLLPLVVPQLITGAILGYVRVHYGLWASVLMHMLHNGMLVAVVLVLGKLV